MIGSLTAQLALLSFSAAVLAGVAAGNSAVTVLSRALICLAAVLIVGQVVGWACLYAVREYLREEKRKVDRQHVEGMEEIESQAAGQAPAQ